MIFLFALLSTAMSFGTVDYIKKNIHFIAEDCQVSLVDMMAGTIKIMKGDKPMVTCKYKGGLEHECVFYGEDNKLYATITTTNVISGQEAVLAKKNSQSDVFIVNLLAKRFYLDSNLFLEHGRGRGRKICAGIMLYDEDLKKK
jgi:hypothetical protein